jgi:hypothetical protein
LTNHACQSGYRGLGLITRAGKIELPARPSSMFP